MRLASASSLLALGLAFQQVSATGWLKKGLFSSPQTHDNSDQCTPEQKNGYEWNDLKTGSFSVYGGMSFSGFSCKNSFDGKDKRTLLKGLFAKKCIAAKVHKDISKCPSIKADKKKAFSIKSYHVNVEFDADVECHYEMPDNSVCKTVEPCKAGGHQIFNKQCGGAKSVVFKLPDYVKKDNCDFGINKIDFDCEPPQVQPPPPAPTTAAPPPLPTTAAPPPPPTTAAPQLPPTTAAPYSPPPPPPSSDISLPVSTPPSSAPPTLPPSSAPSVYVPPTLPPTSAPTAPPSSFGNSSAPSTTAPGTTAPGTTAPGTTAPGTTPPVELTTSTIFSTSIATVTSCAPTVKDCPAKSTVLVTSTIAVSTTICPVSTPPTGVAPTTPTSIAPTTPTTVAPIYETPKSETPSSNGAGSSLAPSSPTSNSYSSGSATAASTAPPAPIETANCPDVLPKCLNTWLHITPCRDNADTDCFCPIQEYAGAVVECVRSWGGKDIQGALSTWAGLCAGYVAKNPAILTAIPTTYTLGYAAPPAPTGAPGSYTPPVQPMTTIVVANTVTVPCYFTTGESSGSPIPSSSTTSLYQTSLEVPQVQLYTQPAPASGTSAAPQVVLAAGTPAPAPAAPTAPTT
ncbi:MAG: hypothetical protein M1832_000911, partial [Thelocarpon impressellum]